ncbi:Eco57I restriction-modification methylase domain-containing protein [Segatella bryantii]|uniref:Eco57I restriction-modification methylase domain-containing protein n=1 Tax=Segatella bryantii TaxID=77095 RepID=UPI000885969D|nr:N-6 DNA methylase [Segatella bryantii]SDM07964.1 hypothetical protein SAMN04487899_11815 [Segatella bryantii]
MRKIDFNKYRKNRYQEIIRSNEYQIEISEIVKRLLKVSKTAPNEATIEANFDMELHTLFNNYFKEIGFEYNPIKEAPVNSTKRNVIRGRADTAIAGLIVEYKQPSTLKNKVQKKSAFEQIEGYIESISKEKEELYQGFITDGTYAAFVNYDGSKFEREDFYKLNENTFNRIVLAILQVKLIALNAKNLVEGLCNTPSNDGVGFKIAKVLFEIIEKNIHPKTQMLFDEWKQLFNLAHDDISKQTAILNRKKALGEIFNRDFLKNNEDEYKALYCIQTSYAIIVKVIAFKIISQARYNTSLIKFYDLIEAESEVLRNQMQELENGAIFIQYGITNLLEGDFFSWYINPEQWNNRLANNISDLFELLSRYADRSVITSTSKCQDFFKELYQTMVPPAVRHSLGEYYTKKWLAKNVIDEALEKLPKKWRALDPCCGSGTFITVLIETVMAENKDIEKKELLKEILNRVKGIDLNPIAALTARVNYFINISELIEDGENIEIPIYLGDASYVPKKIKCDKIDCLEYTISTIKKDINILVPCSMIKDVELFSRTMTDIEVFIKTLDSNSIYERFLSLCDKEDLTNKIKQNLNALAEQLVELEKKKWNGVWARIITNFLSTANLGKYDLVVGNPPWVDWKSLPSKYRDKIKSLCISRRLFSGDAFTGGINLNICALITNVAAQNWLNKNGIMALLMPEPLIFQQSYEGFRNLYIDDERLYIYKLVNWNAAGHPFKPVTQKFLTFYIGHDKVNYEKGVETIKYIKKRNVKSDDIEEIDFNKSFSKEIILAGVCHESKNFFTYANSYNDLQNYSKIAGASEYIGREGIEFYPQELMVFKLSNLPSTKTCTSLVNMQNPKSKYKVPQRNVLIETEMLHPMVKGKDITPFHAEISEFIVPFPYEKTNPQIPINLKRLTKIAPKLANYYENNKEIIKEQTGYSDRIIGKAEAEYYALARVGAYSYAKYYVAMRDNTKWAAAVVKEIDTSWGGKKRPVFQNHAISICEDSNYNFITEDEAYYICGILNTNIVSSYMTLSSDSRSFPIRPRIKIPKYNLGNRLHKKIVKLSKEAHKKYNDQAEINKIVNNLDSLYMQILK